MNIVAIGSALLIGLVGIGLSVGVRPASRHVGGSTGRRRWRRRTSRAAEMDGTAAYLDALAREVRVGSSLTAAFVAITPAHRTAAALLPAHTAVRDGAALDDVLATVDVHDALAVAVHALACAAAVGGPAAPTLDGAAALLRERSAIAADSQSHSAQARLSARVLTAVPICFTLWGVATSARTRSAYLSSPVGAACAGIGLLLNGAGWWWMRRIIARAT